MNPRVLLSDCISCATGDKKTYQDGTDGKVINRGRKIHLQISLFKGFYITAQSHWDAIE